MRSMAIRVADNTPKHLTHPLFKPVLLSEKETTWPFLTLVRSAA